MKIILTIIIILIENHYYTKIVTRNFASSAASDVIQDATRLIPSREYVADCSPQKILFGSYRVSNLIHGGRSRESSARNTASRS